MGNEYTYLRILLDKIHKEFDELMFTKREGLMLEQLTVRDYDLGSSLPVFSNAGMPWLPVCSPSCFLVLFSAVIQQKVFSSTDAGELEVCGCTVYMSLLYVTVGSHYWS